MWRGVISFLLVTLLTAQYIPPGGGGAPSGSAGGDLTGTYPSPTLANANFAPLSPPSAPVATLVALAGSIDAGAHQYCITYLTALGETQCSTRSNIVTTDAGHGRVTVSGLGSSCPSGATFKNLYRSAADYGYWEQLLPVGMPLACATSSYSDNSADSSLLTYAPQVNSTAGTVYSGSSLMTIFGNELRFGNAASQYDTLGSGNPRDVLKDSAFASTAPNGASSDPFQSFGAVGVLGTEVANANTSNHTLLGHRIAMFTSGTGNMNQITGLDMDIAGGHTGTITTVAGIALATGDSGSTAATSVIEGMTNSLYKDVAGTTDKAMNFWARYAASGGTTTDWIGYEVADLYVGGGVTVTNAYGIKVGDIAGAANDWAIKTGLGKVSFGDVVDAAGGSAGKVVCWKADAKTLGYCSSVVGVTGGCTCN